RLAYSPRRGEPQPNRADTSKARGRNETMAEPIPAQKEPYGVNVEAGKRYFWCACGRSANQPFCDGSHQGTGRTPVPFTAEATEADAKCVYTGDAMLLVLDIVVVAERGPAAKADSADFQYFVAVTGPEQAILSKRPFPVRIVFDGPGRRSGVTDHIEQAIPLG